MRVQIFILLSIIVKSQSFGTCTDDTDCPPNATCATTTCECQDPFVPYDTGVAAVGVPYTLCTIFPCTPVESNPCSGNGKCVVSDGQYKCLCYEGFYGEKCEKPVTYPTVMTTTEKKGKGGVLVAAGAGLLALLVLGGGAAALASSSG